MFTLIVLVSIGMLGKYESNAISHVDGFATIERCEEAGKKTLSFAKGVKEVAYVCVQR